MLERDYDTPQRETQISSAFGRLESATEGLMKEVERLENRLSSVRSPGPKNTGMGAAIGAAPGVPLALRLDKASNQLYSLLERVVSLQAELEI
jgi:hypothetical protein